MAKEKLPQEELFASPDDVVKAHRIVEEQLGESFDVNYLGLPKNVGNKGDERQYGHSVVISSTNNGRLQEVIEAARAQHKGRSDSIAGEMVAAADGETLQRVSSLICGATTATRVFLDITFDGCHFSLDKPE